MKTIDEDQLELGISGAEVLELRRSQPWTRSWASRHGRGAEHLRGWLAAGRPAVDRAEVDVDGDPAIAAVVREVLAIVPAPVAWRLVVEHVQIRCGREHCERIPEPCRGYVDRTRDPLYVGVLVADEAVVAHELGHAWCEVPSVAYTCVPLDDAQIERLRAGSLAEAEAAGRAAELEDETIRGELAADRLATLWLGRTVDTTSGRRGVRRRRRIRDEIAAAVASQEREP